MEQQCIVCFSINNWEKRKARKQQFMLHFAQRNDVSAVLYVEPPLNLWRLVFFPLTELRDAESRGRWKRALTFSFQPLTEKLSLATPLFILPFFTRFQSIYNFVQFLYLALLRRLLRRAGFRRPVLWLYHPFDYALLRRFPERSLAIFDWAEEWSEYYCEFNERKREQIRQCERHIIRNSDLVFVCSQRMLAMAKELNPRSYHILDGTVFEVFQNTGSVMPDDMRGIRRPIAGYFGTVSRRVDFDLMDRLATELPGVSFVFIGDVHRQYFDSGALRRHGNVHFLNGKEYAELGLYARHIDVLLLPYKPALTPNSPTKYYDYFATGKPVISTDLIESRKFSDVMYVARTNDEYARLLREALREASPELQKRRRVIAKENSWTKRIEEIVQLMREVPPK